jgi:hypothetical protein
VIATHRQAGDEIRDTPELVTSLESKHREQRLLANAAASEERLNGRFQQAYTELTATLSSTLITQVAGAKQVSTQPTSQVDVEDTPKGGIMEHDARSAQLPTERPSIKHTVQPMALAPATTVNIAAMPYVDYHIDT